MGADLDLLGFTGWGLNVAASGWGHQGDAFATLTSGIQTAGPSSQGGADILFFFYLTIAIYTTHTHTLFEEGRGDSNLCQMGGNFSLAPLGQMPSGLLSGLLCMYLLVTFSSRPRGVKQMERKSNP